MNTEVNKRTLSGWNNWSKMAGVLCDNRVTPHVKGKIHKIIVQSVMLYGMETVPMTSSHVKTLEVTQLYEDVQMGIRPHTKIPYEKR